MERRVLAGLVIGLGWSWSGCAPEPPRPDYPADPREARFAGFDETCAGIPARMSWDHLDYAAGRGDPNGSSGLTELEREGACTWYFWPGGDPLTPLARGGSPEDARGNPRFWRQAEVRTARIAEETGLHVGVNLLAFVDSRRRGERFEKLGLVNDPGCREASAPDPYGLWLDECEDPYSAGVLGVRLFPNPEFEPARWSPERYLAPDRSTEDAAIEPPYLAGLTCAVCHVTFSPARPPDDPEHPEWENLAPALGNQYLREGEMFKAGLSEEDFLYHVYDTQQPGTSDTSRISVDWINNPNAVNSIFFILSHRPTYPETLDDGRTEEVPHILKDGADSIGPVGAALRVYVNIGTCPDYRESLESTFTGLERQEPFLRSRAAEECADWRLTEERMVGAAAFLDSIRPYRLADAPGGPEYLDAPEEELALGRRVFAGHCARCHSSKLPPGYRHDGPRKHSREAREDWIELVERPDFLEGNFLSDDRRYPLVSDDPRFAIGTNAARALATNATAGHVWQNFSSATYKDLPSPGTLTLYNPFTGERDLTHEIPAGGTGYYRTPSLVSLWATAPFFHNNSLGVYTGDPSVAGRMEAYEDAAEKLLWPERRRGEGSIKVTPRPTVLRLRGVEVHVPEGTPVNLLANVDLRRVLRDDALFQRFTSMLRDPERLVRLVAALENRGEYDEELAALVPELLALNQAPDFVEDHGHDTHVGPMSDAEKRALTEYMKTF